MFTHLANVPSAFCFQYILFSFIMEDLGSYMFKLLSSMIYVVKKAFPHPQSEGSQGVFLWFADSII